jgi:hypothetical protein
MMAKLKNLPPQKQIEADIIQVLNSLGNKARRKKVIDALAKKWRLTQEELGYHTPGGWVYYEHRIDGVAHKLRSKGRIVTDNDGLWQLLEGKPKKLPIVSSLPPLPKRHDELKQKMIYVGKKLGYHVSAEEGALYRHDVLWKQGAYKSPCHVIEICEGGSLPKDFDALHWANDPKNWGAQGILIVTDDKDFEKAGKRFVGQPGLIAVKAETVDALCKIVDDNPEFLELIFSKES